jgi:hypothetical protein
MGYLDIGGKIKQIIMKKWLKIEKDVINYNYEK